MKKNKNMGKITPPPSVFENGTKKIDIDVSNFLLDLRSMMNKTIDEFVYDLGWANDKYYSKIVNGFKNKEGTKSYSNPSVNYIFGALKYAFENNEQWRDKKEEITKLVLKYFL